MHHSSENIGKIAGALAQAQRRLENPEKTLTANITSPFPREGASSFRYASLANGLEIIRKALSEQEIAAIQRTEIDKDLGLIRLNTVLAHSSGEWIASDWPVCATTDVGVPHRLGAALTYARRYALFALVGITGEDDLDAPDLPIQSSPATRADPGNIASLKSRPSRGKLLAAPESADTRDKFINELGTIDDSEDLTLWALRRLPLKNKLLDADAVAVEAAYRTKLEGMERRPAGPSAANGTMSVEQSTTSPSDNVASEENIGSLSRPLRRRSKAHLAFVASHPCLVCQRTPSDAHHLKFAQTRAMGRKVSDEFTVPLCREHHNALHAQGNEPNWWANLGITPLERARELWQERLMISGETNQDVDVPRALP